MGDSKISGLPSASGFNPTDVFVVVQNGVTKQVPVTLITGGTGGGGGDTYVTGATYNSGQNIFTFTNNSGGTFNVVDSDVFVTGGTYISSASTITFTNKTGGTFNVTGVTNFNNDVFVTGGTWDDTQKIITFTNNTGGTFNVTNITDNYLPLSGGTLTGDLSACSQTIYSSAISGCSPLVIGATSGLTLNDTINVSDNSVGIRTDYTNQTLNVLGTVGVSALTSTNDGLDVGSGVISYVGDDTVVTYTGGFSTFTVPSGVTSLRVLVVGAGGGGGGATAGGGGAGEYYHETSYPVTPGSAITVTIGFGGGGGTGWSTSSDGNNGTNSVFGSITARGGGGGGSRAAVGNNGGVGLDGGSGGGAGVSSIGGTTGGTATAMSPGLGFNGGNHTGSSVSECTTGGGGGAGSVGGTGIAGVNGGDGGSGITNDISGVLVGYAGGGGGGARGDTVNQETGGAGSNIYGSGRGGSDTATPDTYNASTADVRATSGGAMDARPNSGSGGGGAGYDGSSGSVMGGAGGSGIVIVRFTTVKDINGVIHTTTGGTVGINTINPDLSSSLDISGKTRTDRFQMTSGATDSAILTSDAAGNAIWNSGLTLTDTFVTGATYDNDIKRFTFTNNSGNTFNVSNFDVFVTGGNFTQSAGTISYFNNTGGTFNVTGLGNSFSGYGNTIIVAKSGGDYTSLKAAIDVSTGSSLFNPTTIIVKGGTYFELPMNIPEYVSVTLSNGVYLVAIDNSSTFIEMNSNSGWHGGTLLGPTGGTVMYTSGVTNTLIRECTLGQGETGINISQGSRLIVDTVFIGSAITTGFISSFGSRVDTSSVVNFANTQYYANGGEFWMINCAGEGGETGIYSNNGGFVKGNYLLLNNLTNGIRTGLSGDSEIDINCITIHNTTNPINQESSTGKITLQHGDIDNGINLIENWDNVNIGFYQSSTGSSSDYKILNDACIGSVEKPSHLCIGEGSTTEKEILVYVESGGTFSDVSEAAISEIGSSFSFSGVDADNAIYFSTNLNQDGNKYAFGGLESVVETAAVIGGGEIVWEYWNGSGWIEFTVSQYGSKSPYLQSRVMDFSDVSIGKDMHVRFNLNIYDDWDLNDPISSGTDRYWVRFRIKTAITTSPVFEYFKIHSNKTEFNGDGWFEYFGKARPIGTLPWSMSNLTAANNSPDNQDVYISDALNVGRTENNFLSGATDRTGFVSVLPQDLDVSTPIEICWYWYTEGSSGGDVRWVVRWGYTNNNFNVYNTAGAAPSTGPNEQELIIIDSAPTSPNVTTNTSALLDVQGFISREIDGLGDLIWCTLERTGNNASDTHGDDIVAIDILPYYHKWCEGGHRIFNSYTEIFNDGFESGSFATSGWTTVNDTTNVWVVGSADTASGTYSAYISDDGGTTNDYDPTTTNISHVYVDVPIPSGATVAKLTFSWECEGEQGPGDFDYDFGKVYIAPTSVTPVAGAHPSATYRVGRVKYNEQSIWTGEDITISPSFIGSTARIIFTWDNDFSIGAAPSFSIDNVVVKYI